MAGITSRTILVCAFPAIITLLSFLWVRKKKKQSLNSNNTIISDSIDLINRATAAESGVNYLNSNQNNLEWNSIDTPLTAVDDLALSTLEQELSHNISAMGEEEKQMTSLAVTESTVKASSTEVVSIVQALEELRLCENQSSLDNVDFNVDNKCDWVEKGPVINGILDENTDNLIEAQSDQEELVIATSEAMLITSESLLDMSMLVVDTQQPLEEENEGEVVEEEIHCLKLEDLNSLNERDSISLPKSSQSEDQDSIHADVFQELDDVIESPPPSIYSDGHSEDSSDSGKGGSDIQGSTGNYDFSSSPLSSSEDPLHLQVYEFELAQDLCGRLIGRLGKHVNFIKSRTNANVFIKRHPFNPQMKICSIEGTQAEIKSTLEMIRKRFPLSQYSNVTLVQVNLPLTCGIMVPETLQLNLPEGVTCDVILSSMVSAGHFFIQQPTHPTYPSLSRLDICMSTCYSQIDTPLMPQPVEVGVICSAPTMGGWYRAQVVNIYENSEECDIKFVDYGGYSCIPLNSLRQIRSDFMTLPFQASECYLANVRPIEDVTSCEEDASESQQSGSWSLEASATFEELAQGQILQALVVGHADDGVPCVHLYRVQGVSTVFINRELVNRGIAQWLELSQA